jgi:uncharacterized protein YndB with AHSA1/START domain
MIPATLVLIAAFGASDAGPVRTLRTGSFAFDLEVTVPTNPEDTWRAFTEETLEWWDHHFSEHPKKLGFDARPGGGFVEIFDDAGNGAWHATVILAEKPKRLRFTGPLGLSGTAIDMVHSLEIEPLPEGTKVKLAVHAVGEVPPGAGDVVRRVWNHFLVERFKPYLTGKAGKGRETPPPGP